MKFKLKFLAPLLLCALALTAVPLLPGCKNPQKATFVAAGTSVITVEAAMSAWGDYVDKFHPPAAEELKVKAAFEKYQATALVVADAGAAYAASGTAPDAKAKLDLAIASAVGSLGDLVKLIQSFGVNISPQ